MTKTFQLHDGILTIRPGTEYLRSEMFAENTGIREAILPEGLRHISVACFTSCVNLEKINLPSTVKTVDDGAFLFCEKLTEIVFPDQLEEIADLSFQGTGLRKAIIPASVRKIGEEAFFECENLQEIAVLGEDTFIGDDAFGSCYHLKSGYVAPGFPTIGHPGSELLYSLLWAGCPEKHKEETGKRARAFITANEDLVMEKIIGNNNVAAMTGVAENHLLSPEKIDGYIRKTTDLGLTELTALLIRAKGGRRNVEEEFEL